MDQATIGWTERTVRIETLHGSIEGHVLISQLMRTLDELNMVSKAFLIVHSSVLDGTGWSFPDGELSVNKSNILFLAELSSPAGGQSEKFVDFTRAPVRIRVGPFDVEGFVHVPPRGDPLLRFNQDTHPFIAVTSASVVGPNRQFEAPFLAIKRSHILAVQPMDHDEAPELAGVSESSETDG